MKMMELEFKKFKKIAGSGYGMEQTREKIWTRIGNV